MSIYGYFFNKGSRRSMLLTLCLVRLSVLVCLLGFVLMFARVSAAHEMGDGVHISVDLNAETAILQVDITLRELIAAFDVDADGDGNVSIDEFKGIGMANLAQYVKKNLVLRIDKERCRLKLGEGNIVEHESGAFVRYLASHGCPEPEDVLYFNYSLFFDQNPYHQGTLTVTQGQHSSLYYFWEDQTEHTILIKKGLSMLALVEGVKWGGYHILIGFDHLLFLLCLVLPSVLILGKADTGHNRHVWSPASSLWPVIVDVVKVVTAFTVAHTITLTASVMGWVTFPDSALIEALIAITVMFVAINNVMPVVYRSRWLVTALLGLVHGFGFANVLNTKGLSELDLGWALFAFNIGVELGQLLAIFVVVPLLYLLRNWPGYVNWILRVGSVVAFSIAGIWFFERLEGIY